MNSNVFEYYYIQSGVEENVHPGQSELMIKEECGFDITQENDDDRALYSTHYVEQNTSSCCSKCVDISSQMKQIAVERDNLIADLLNAKKECHEISNERTNIERDAAKKNIEIKKLKICEENLTKDIITLKEQVNDMSAVVHDFEKRNAALTNKMSAMYTDGDVEDVVGHKMQKGVEMYIVKLKNTWLPVGNLNCDSKLRKYRKKNKMAA